MPLPSCVSNLLFHRRYSMCSNRCILHHIYFNKPLLAYVVCPYSESKVFPPRIWTFLSFYNRQKCNQNVTKAVESPSDGQRNKQTKKIPSGCKRVKASETLSEIASSGISPKWKAYIEHAFQGLWTHFGLRSLKRSTAAFKIHPAHL